MVDQIFVHDPIVVTLWVVRVDGTYGPRLEDGVLDPVPSPGVGRTDTDGPHLENIEV